MKFNKSAVVGLALLGSISVAFAAGLWPGLPIVGGATYCAGSSSSATGTIIGAVTGCPNQVPAGPSIVSGGERIPADTNLSGGANPQTVLLSMASLNALPISVVAVTASAVPANISATNLSGGVIYLSAGTIITTANVTLPLSPIDGQQYAISANRVIPTLTVTAAAGATIAANSNPTALTPTTTSGLPQGYRFLFNAASTSWVRLQ